MKNNLLESQMEGIILINSNKIDNKSNATIVEDGKTLLIDIPENSRTIIYEIQNPKDNKINDINKKIICKKGSSLSRFFICSGNSSIKSEVNIYLDENSEANDAEIFFGSNEQNFELNTNLIHEGKNSKGNVLIKGVLLDKAKCFSNGIIKVKKEAKKTNTFLAEHILLLSKDAKAQAIPALEIEADDIQAGHSASVTQIDGDQIFYLTTRGIEENGAKKMIAYGFLQSILNGADSYIKNKFNQLFEEKWK